MLRRLGPNGHDLNQLRSLLRHRSHFAGSAIAGTSSDALRSEQQLWMPQIVANMAEVDRLLHLPREARDA
jgi:hypothetical protein